MTNQDTTEPEQWAVEQHIKKNPKCEWLCTHTKLENLGEQPQIDEPNLDREIVWLLKAAMLENMSEGAVNRHKKAFKQLIATQIQEARVDELRRIPRTNYGNDFTIHIKAYLDSRIKELGE